MTKSSTYRTLLDVFFVTYLTIHIGYIIKNILFNFFSVTLNSIFRTNPSIEYSASLKFEPTTLTLLTMNDFSLEVCIAVNKRFLHLF